MVSTVRRLPSHYETLGLSPTATADEIARAFAREISAVRPRAFGGVAQVSIAYETLRDPIKRQAYDASLGFAPEPRRPDAPPPPERRSKPQPRSASTERTTGSFIAASLREPMRAQDASPAPDPKPAKTRQPEPSPESRIPDFLAVRREPAESFPRTAEDRPIEWKKVGVAVGGLVLAVGLVSAIARLSGGEAEEPRQAQADVTIPLPAATPIANTNVPRPAENAVKAPVEAANPAGVAAPLVEPDPSSQQPAVAEKQAVEPGASVESGTAEALAEGTSRPAPAETPPAQTVAASLPLSNSTIARTIERIGYACGEVASTAAVGAPGVYKVTCTSGQSYQATPVNGRYRFRRWGTR